MPTTDITETAIGMLQQLQRARLMYIKAQSRLERAVDFAIARDLGYRAPSEKADKDQRQRTSTELKKLMAQAKKYRDTIEAVIARNDKLMLDPDAAALVSDVENPDPRVSFLVFDSVKTFYRSRSLMDHQRDRVQAEMERYAKMLPVWSWVDQHVSGVGARGLAVIVGEAGDIGDYSGPGKLWKRLGLACIDGKPQNAVPKNLSREEVQAAWKLRGYKPERRAQVWAFLDDLLFRAQWRGDRDINGKNPTGSKLPVAVQAHPIGPYGAAYGERKAWNLARGLLPAHADKEARRFMAKTFLRDLWCVWHGVAVIHRMPQAMAAE